MSLIFGDLGGYIANRAMENEEYRLDVPEPGPAAMTPKVAPKSRAASGLGNAGRWVQAFSQHIFNANPNSKKTVEEGKAGS